jgi:predicted polyphosphate/ATP-dependent NAD kinase
LNSRSGARRIRLGVIVNPIAGMGGKAGLKGTDGPGVTEEARRRGAVPIAAERARLALARMAIPPAGIDILTGHGDLGEVVLHALRLHPTLVGYGADYTTTADDTRAAAAEMLACDVDLILFAGGDGTARDIFDIVGSRIPILGVPTGVKMHSAVFATNPQNAGDVASRFLADPEAAERPRDAEIMDIDESLLRCGRISARLYGYARVPYERLRVQHLKAAAPRDADAALDALCRDIAGSLQSGRHYLFGPGTTTQTIMRHAGIEGTLLGIDAVSDGRAVGRDLDERAILALAGGKRTCIVVSIVGGQGCLFGRGNQQISAEVIKRVGRDGILVVSSLDKLLALNDRGLFVDTGDAEADAMLAGYMRVEVAPDQSIICKVSS